jgi:hypothetical protein
LGPEGGRPDRPTQTVRHTCSENKGIVKILRYIRSDMYTASATNSRQEDGPLANGALMLSTHKHSGKSGTAFRYSIYMQSVPITTDVVSSTPAQGEEYNIM